MTQYTTRARIVRLLERVHQFTLVDAATLVAKEPEHNLADWMQSLEIEHMAMYGTEL